MSTENLIRNVLVTLQTMQAQMNDSTKRLYEKLNDIEHRLLILEDNSEESKANVATVQSDLNMIKARFTSVTKRPRTNNDQSAMARCKFY